MTKDAVAGVVTMLRERGEPISQRKVLAALGTGSKRDVARYLHELEGATTDAVPGDPVYEPDVASEKDADGEPGEPGTTRDDTVPVQDGPGDDSDEPNPVQAAQDRLTRAEQDLATAQATVATALAELEVATVQESEAREAYHTHEALRLRTGDGDAGTRDAARQAWAAARCQAEALTDVITSLRQDVARAQQTVHEADAGARRAVARQEWDARVPQQHQAMARLEQSLREAKSAVDTIIRLAREQEPHGELLGIPADAYLFHRRALNWWLQYRLSELAPSFRPDPSVYHWAQNQSLVEVNPFAKMINDEPQGDDE